MKLNYFLFWLSGIDITVLLGLACRAMAKAAFRAQQLEDEQSWNYLLHPPGQQIRKTLQFETTK